MGHLQKFKSTILWSFILVCSFVSLLIFNPVLLMAISINDLPPEIQNLLGQPTDWNCGDCLPHPNVTPQLSDDLPTYRTWVPAQIINADRGHLIMVPSDGMGNIGALLESLQPPQHYSHMGIMTRDNTVIRHCTASQEWLMRHSVRGGNPTDGFTEKAMKFGWPGTLTQTVEGAWRSSRGDANALTLKNLGGSAETELPDLHVLGPVSPDNDIPRMESFVIHELGFDPVSVPILDSDYAKNTIFADPNNALPPDRDSNIRYETMWPLVVKPCPWLNDPAVLAALDRIAAAAESICGHYRFHGYVDALIAEDSAQFGDPAFWEADSLPDPRDPCKKVRVAFTRGMVCSTFIWEAVREANRLGSPHIWLTLPIDRSVAQCGSFYLPPAGDEYSIVDGLFDYPADEIRRAALWFGASLHRTIDGEASYMPWWASPLESAYEFFTDIVDDVANQIGSAFAFDWCNPSYKDDDTWLRGPPVGRSCSPDNIIRSWMPPMRFERDPSNLHGIYGYNEQVIMRPGKFADRPKTIWRFSEGPGTIYGNVFYKNEPVAGAKVKVFCHTTYTNSDGIFSLEVPAGMYLLTAGKYFPQPAGQSAWWAEAEQPVKIVHGQRNPGMLRIDLEDPPGENRMLIVQGHADCVNRHVIGHDWWGHPHFTCPIVHLGNYNIAHDANGSEGDKNPAGGYTTSWSYTIDEGWFTGISVRARRIDQSATNPADPYPLEVSVTFMLGSAGAGWPFNPEKSTSATVIVPTDGSRHITADLDVGWIAPLRSHIEIDLLNYRQG